MYSGKLMIVPLVAAKKKKFVAITDQTGMQSKMFLQGMTTFVFYIVEDYKLNDNFKNATALGS